MLANIMEKIDKCNHCDKAATYLWYRIGFFSVKVKVLCGEHRLLRGDLK